MADDLGFRIAGPCRCKRQLVHWPTAFAAYACLDASVDVKREGYLSAFTFGDDFKRHLDATGSTKGFDGPCEASFIWFDIDRADLEYARREAARLCLCLAERFSLDDDMLLAFFSGSKGFHVGLPTNLWHPSASSAFHRVAKRLAQDLAAAAAVEIDVGIYDRVRAFRAPNSRHAKTGLHKRRLSLDELMHLSIKRIQALAKEPLPFDIPTCSSQSDQAATDWREAARRVEEDIKSTRGRRVTNPKLIATDRTEVDSVRSVLSVATPLIEATLPPAYGNRRKCLFRLARLIHADPKLRDVPVHRLEPVIREWHHRALPNIRDKPFDDSWCDFVEAHGNVDPSRLGDAVQGAMARADAKEIPPEAMKYDTPLVRRLVALCAELSRSSLDGEFYLACRKGASVLGTPDHKLINRWLRVLVSIGLLEETFHGEPETNRASRYRYLNSNGKPIH